MVTLADYGEYETAWCPGCGNFLLLDCLKQALVNVNLEPHNVLIVSGIGQAAKAPHDLNANVFNGLHGRSLPVATGAKLANPELTVIAESGDGCMYGEGGNHFLSAIRRNIDITVIVHNNQVYGLTKGQASPTSEICFVTKAQPEGVVSEPFNPVLVAVAMRGSFVARGFVGEKEHLTSLLQQAIIHPGFSLVDVLQNCISFNKFNTFKWYKERVKKIPDSYDPTNWDQALKLASEWGDSIPIGLIYKNDRQPFSQMVSALKKGAPVKTRLDKKTLVDIMDTFK